MAGLLKHKAKTDNLARRAALYKYCDWLLMKSSWQVTGSGDCADAARVQMQRAPAKKRSWTWLNFHQSNMRNHERHISTVYLAIVAAKDKIIGKTWYLSRVHFCPPRTVLIQGCFQSKPVALPVGAEPRVSAVVSENFGPAPPVQSLSCFIYLDCDHLSQAIFS